MILNLINIYKFCKKNNIQYLFYSESSHYQKYFFNYIYLLNKKGLEIVYLSSDKKDRINLKNVKNIYVGNGITRFLVFMFVKTKYFFLTVTDLNNNILKKNLFVKKYIYIFHAATSVHKNYTKSAFDNYDCILCLGQYQKNEIIKIEEIFNLKKKELLNAGYFYFDYLLEKANFNKIKKFILIAPSWNKSKENFLNHECEHLIENLLKQKFNLIFRPHPEHFNRNKIILDRLKNKYANLENFIFDENEENLDSMEKSYLLITDNSGISIEYSLIFKRPVIYFDKFNKIHNKAFDKIDIETIEDKFKKEFGYLFNLNDLENFEEKINLIHKEFDKKQEALNKFINTNFFNFGKSAEFAFEHFEKKKKY